MNKITPVVLLLLVFSHTYYSKGSSIIKFVPTSNLLVTRMEPLCNSTISLATASPIPFPPVALVLDLSTQ